MRVWIAVGLLCLSLGAASQPAPATRDNVSVNAPKKQPKAEQRASAQVSVPLQSQRNVDAARTARKQEQERQEKMANERAIADSTVAIAWLTFFLFIVAALQAMLFRKQLRLMRDGAADAKHLAQAAVSSATLARETFIADHRPWLKIDSIEQKGADDKDGGYNFAVSIKNLGSSPAVCIWVNALMVGDHFPNDDQLGSIVEKMRRKAPSPGVTLLPGDARLIDGYCASDSSKNPMDDRNLGVMVCCAYYSFPFDKSKGGHYVSAGRVYKESLNERDLTIRFDHFYGHAE